MTNSRYLDESSYDIAPSHSPSESYHDPYSDITNQIDSLTNSSSLKPVLDVNVDNVETTAMLNMVVFAMFILVYEVLLRKFPSLYNYKKLDRSKKESALPTERSCWPLAWVKPVLEVSWREVRREAGLDAYFFLRYIRVCANITTASAIWAGLLLWPTYYSGEGNMTGFYAMSMSNVAQSRWRLWVPSIFIWLMTAYVVYVLDLEFRHYLLCRMEFLGKGWGSNSEGDSCDVLDGKSVNESCELSTSSMLHNKRYSFHPQARYSVIVEKIPVELRSDNALYDYFNSLLPGKVHSACVVMNVSELERKIYRRMRVVRRLEKAQAFNRATGKWATHKVGTPRCSILGVDLLPFCSNKTDDNVSKINRHDMGKEIFSKGEIVDSVEYYTRELAMFNAEVLSFQRELKETAQNGNDQNYDASWFRRLVDHFDDSASNPPSRPESPSEQHYGSFESINKGRNFKPSVRRLKSLRDTYLNKFGEDLIIQPGGEDKNETKLRRFMNKIGFSFLSSVCARFKKQIDLVVDTVIGRTMSSSGFVTFTSLSAVTFAASANLCHLPDTLEAKMAPTPRDIIWKNASIPKSYNDSRIEIASGFLMVGAILWSVPLVAIQAFATADSLSRVPGMGWILSSNDDRLASLINGYLPVLALLALIMILPMIFEWIAVAYERRKTHSDVQQSILNRYFYYQLGNIYITVTAGSIWDSLFDIMQAPSSAFRILGRSMPTVVGYFVSFLLTKILAGLPLVLMRGGSLSKMMIYKFFFNERLLTQRELDEAIYKREQLLYGWEYPTQLLVIVICFTYACISPIILFCGAIYFHLALIVYKKQVLYVFTAEYENGGAMFPSVLQRTLVGLVCGQFTFLGYMILREGYFQPLVLFPLPFVTTTVMTRFHDYYIKSSSQLSVQKARQLDESHKQNTMEHFREETFRQPSLTAPIESPMSYRRGESLVLT